MPSEFDFRYDEPLPPAKAIREFCKQCTGGDLSEIRNCTATPDKCRTFPYRAGRGCDRSREPNPPTRLKSIRQECLLCMGGSRAAVRECDSYGCFFWPSRMGHRPKKQSPESSLYPPETDRESTIQTSTGATPCQTESRAPEAQTGTVQEVEQLILDSGSPSRRRHPGERPSDERI